jgi:hypothetical protein
MKGLIYNDTRFWEVFDEQGNSLGLHMYGDLIDKYTSIATGRVLDSALTWLKHLNYTWKIVGDICPLEEDSTNPIIQAKKVEYRRRERKKEKKQAKKRGFRPEDKVHFGKFHGYTIKEIIDGHLSYFQWLLTNNVLLLHPDTLEYFNSKK